jgi:RNA polymerase sigma-70 factor, ECF subfamily
LARPDAEYDLVFAAEYRPVMRTVYLLVHDLDAAEDVTQEAFIRLYVHWSKVSRYDRPGAWVRRVAIRLSIDRLRRERLRAVLERDAPAPVSPGGEDVDVLRAVRSLPRMQRAAVVLFYLEGRPTPEIADLIGCSEATVRVHLRRGRARLAALLGEEVTEDVT